VWRGGLGGTYLLPALSSVSGFRVMSPQVVTSLLKLRESDHSRVIGRGLPLSWLGSAIVD
jgi:hypothetical protein